MGAGPMGLNVGQGTHSRLGISVTRSITPPHACQTPSGGRGQPCLSLCGEGFLSYVGSQGRIISTFSMGL